VSARFALATGRMALDAVVAAGREAEALGYEAVLVGEARLEADAFVTAAAVLSATSRVRCGPGVANAYDRHPLALARAAAALDRLAPGRALLGIGRGERSDIEAGLGVPWEPSPLADALAIVGPLLAGRGVAHEGRRWSGRVEAAPERSAAGHRVPVLLAAVGPRTLRLAGSAADGVLLNYGASLEYVRWAVGEVAEGARAASRAPESVDVYGYLLVARTDAGDAASRLDMVRRTLEAVHGIPEQGAALSGQSGGSPREWDDAALRRYAVVGTREECLARVEEYRAAGVRCPVLLPSAMRALHG
jgi:5,10-methylenetetrahydromethanopterin reductase